MWSFDVVSREETEILKTSKPKFQLCYGEGKVQLPLLEQPPQLLQNLLF